MSQIQDALIGVAGELAVRQLLQSAAIQTVQQQGAYISSSTSYPAPDAYRRDTRPVCDAAALHYLDILLQGYHPAILWQWTMLIHARQQRIPDNYLPYLLDTGSNISWMLQVHLREFLGKRALWLVHQGHKQHPHWRWITDMRLKPDDAARSAHNLQHKVTRILRGASDEKSNWTFMDELCFRQFPWTDMLTRSFILYLNAQVTTPHKDLIFSEDLILMLAHYASTDFLAGLIRALQQHATLSDVHLSYIEHVMTFRRRLVQDLKGVPV
ncbi:MAG: hypothetical protein ACPG7F_05645 [Aggregatilineales bacterium]